METRRNDVSSTLYYLYMANTLLCIGMVFWIVVFPSNWLVGRSKMHDDILLAMLDPPFTIHKEAFTKYQGHSLVQFTHILPGALWCAIVPFQLNPNFRKRAPRIHRILGYMFFTSSFLISIGLATIMKRELHFESSFEDLPPAHIISAEIPTVIFGFYFFGTGILALKCAKELRFSSHQKWVIRHIAAGIWVSIQRLLMLTIYAWFYPPPVSRQVQKRVFGEAAYVGSAISMAVAEYAIYLLSKQQRYKKT